MKIDAIFEFDNIVEIEEHLRSMGLDNARRHLIDGFFELVEYRNAREWNRLVRICEALAITGWGKYEPVEASAEKWINGSFFTDLTNKYFQKRYLSAGWKRMGESFVLNEHWRYYYQSPDRPALPELKTSAYYEKHPSVDAENYGVTKLETQRIRLPKNPVRLQGSAHYFPIFEPFVESLRSLRERLDFDTRPELYGNGFGYLGVQCTISSEGSTYFYAESDIPNGFGGAAYVRPRIKSGRLSAKQGELRMVAERHFSSAFGDLTLDEQKARFSEDLLDILRTLAERIQKKKLNYDTDLLLADVGDILTRWTAKQHHLA